MKKWLASSLIVTTLAMLIVVACVPQTTPVATPTPAAPQVASTPLVPVAPVISAEETAWQKVVEAAKREGKVNVYSINLVGDVGIVISKAFKDRYGITLDITIGRPATFEERLKTEKRMGQMVADMYEGGPPLAPELLGAPTGDILPVLREKGVWLVDPTVLNPKETGAFIIRLNQQTPYINTQLVKPGEAPNSWKDLLEPKWMGKMMMSDPSLNTNFPSLAAVMLRNKIWDEDYVKALYRQKLIFADTIPNAFRLLAAGQASLLIDGSDSSAGAAAKEGAPIQAIDMREGNMIQGNGVELIRGGPNPNAALVLLNWLLSFEGQTVYGKVRGIKMLRRDVPDFRPPATAAKLTNPILFTTEDLNKGNQLFKEKWFNKLVGR